MFETLSEKQLSIAKYTQGKVVVKACPGSGKTFSVAARIANLIQTCSFKQKGIAALSFTNVACDEIQQSLKENFHIENKLGHPHYLGTLDGFLNQYVFLPYGHLVMGCNQRPELIGEPHSTWSLGKNDKTVVWGRVVDANPLGYFDITSFDINDRLVALADARNFHFSFKPEKYFNKGGSVNKRIQDVINAKIECFKSGYANQSDANYLSLKILQKYPLILDNVAHRFEYFIIDEAQDTDEIKMSILDMLCGSGLSNIMLIGDRDQSIFEWNSAKPELFDNKFEEWEQITLQENRRSSQNICNTTVKLSSFDRIQAVNEKVSKYDFKPKIFGYKPKSTSKKNPISFSDSKATFDLIMTQFVATCEQNDIAISPENVAVLYRSKSASEYLGLKDDVFDFMNSPWMRGAYHVAEVIRGKHLIDCGNLTKGVKVIERGYWEAIKRESESGFYCTRVFLDKTIEELGIREYRDHVFKFIDILPSTRNKTITQWVNEANNSININYNFEFSINARNGMVLIDDFYASNLNKNDFLPFFHGTIHSAKGKTFDTVLLILKGKPGNKSSYSNMILKGCKKGEEEELRNVYVAITRPRKILFMAVPETDVRVWSDKLLT